MSTRPVKGCCGLGLRSRGLDCGLFRQVPSRLAGFVFQSGLKIEMPPALQPFAAGPPRLAKFPFLQGNSRYSVGLEFTI
jgi:hypothetical protein